MALEADQMTAFVKQLKPEEMTPRDVQGSRKFRGA
jgi:hypothetical protein